MKFKWIIKENLVARQNLDAEIELIQLLGDEITIEQNQRFIAYKYEMLDRN